MTDENALQVVQGKKKERFSTPRLLVSIYPHLSDRASAPDDASYIAQTVYEQLLTKKLPELDTQEIVSTTYEVLERFDRNAALKYALHHGMISLPSRQRRK